MYMTHVLSHTNITHMLRQSSVSKLLIVHANRCCVETDYGHIYKNTTNFGSV